MERTGKGLFPNDVLKMTNAFYKDAAAAADDDDDIR